MNDQTWLDAFDHALEAAGVGPLDRAAARVETEGFLADSGSSAIDNFGPPDHYANELACALNGAVRLPVTVPTDVIGTAVEVRRVRKSYRRHVVLADVSFTVERGEVVVLTGPNGAGKSTLLRIIAGLERADAGSVTTEGTVGYVPQVGGLDPYLTADEHFELFGAAAGQDREQSRREGRRLATELGWDAAAAPLAGELSGGTAQKLSVITALLGRPDTLLLDEPYQGMDADSQQRLWSMLWAWQAGGRSAVVSSHAADALAKASKVVEIDGLPNR